MLDFCGHFGYDTLPFFNAIDEHRHMALVQILGYFSGFFPQDMASTFWMATLFAVQRWAVKFCFFSMKMYRGISWSSAFTY